jgi:hypothetical protein
MKSTQEVVVDKGTGSFSQSFKTGHTHLLGHDFSSRGDDFRASVSESDRSITVNMKGETASRLFPFMIDYDFTVTYDRASGYSSVYGTHDGFPSYVLSVDGQVIYNYQQGFIGQLLGCCDVTVGHGASSW